VCLSIDIYHISFLLNVLSQIASSFTSFFQKINKINKKIDLRALLICYLINMFSSNSHSHQNSRAQSHTSSPWHTASQSNHKTSSNRFNTWAYDDDVENTNEQIAPNHPPPPPHQPVQTMFSWSLESEVPSDNIWSVPQPRQQPPPPQQPPVNPIDVTPITIPQEDLPVEYPVEKRGLYNRNYYKGYVDTRKGIHPEHGLVEYITIRDVFEYVTLGQFISDSDLDVLNKLITKEITTHITLELMETSFNGHAYKCETPVFSYEHYGIIAKHCLEWALCNPEKLGRN